MKHKQHKTAGKRVEAAEKAHSHLTQQPGTSGKKHHPLVRLMAGPWPEGEGYRRHREIWATCLVVAAVLVMEMVSLFLSAETVPGLFGAYFASPGVILLNLAPLALLAGFLYALTGITSLSAGLPGILLLILTLINGIKINLRGDPFLFSDVFLTGEAGDMMNTYSIYLSAEQIFGIVLTVFLVIALVLLTARIRLKGHWKARGIVAAGCALVLAVLMLAVYPSLSIYKAVYAGADIISTRSDAQWYNAHGFTYAFLHSAVEEKAPVQVYDEDEAAQAMEDLYAQTSDIPQDKKVNIIAVQLEAYCDLSDYLDIPAVEEVYSAIHEIEAQAVSGDLIDNIFGGGTVNTERSFITGYTSLPDFTEDTNSYAWYLMSQGYTVQGSHPGNDWFYDRDTINANLGFEHYYFSENYYQELVNVDAAPWHSDSVFLPELINLMEEADGPYFSMDISYQNHGPYEGKSYTGTEYVTAEDCPNETARNVVNNYLKLVSSTNEVIAEMVERLEEMDTPVMLVMFGDHKPYLGSGSIDAYQELGINMDVSTDEGFFNTYSTPYFIWTNSAAKEMLGNDCVGDGGSFGSCFLMNKVFELCGWTGNAFMQASNKLMETTTVVHSAVEVYYQNGEFVDELSEEDQAALDEFLSFQQYWQTNFQYEEAAEESAKRLEAEQKAAEEAAAAAAAEAAAAESAAAEAAAQQAAQEKENNSNKTSSNTTQQVQTSQKPTTSTSPSSGTTTTTGGGTTANNGGGTVTADPSPTVTTPSDTPSENPAAPSEDPGTPSTDPIPSESPTAPSTSPSTSPSPSTAPSESPAVPSTSPSTSPSPSTAPSTVPDTSTTTVTDSTPAVNNDSGGGESAAAE